MVYLLLPVHVINTIDSNLILRGKRNTLVVKPIEMEQTTQFTANIFVCECMDLMILMANENFFTNITCVFSLVLTPSFMHVYIRCSINFLSKSMLPYLLIERERWFRGEGLKLTNLMRVCVEIILNHLKTTPTAQSSMT